jgi:hypothetical protein
MRGTLRVQLHAPDLAEGRVNGRGERRDVGHASHTANSTTQTELYAQRLRSYAIDSWMTPELHFSRKGKVERLGPWARPNQ